jgi:hypothetical protein
MRNIDGRHLLRLRAAIELRYSRQQALAVRTATCQQALEVHATAYRSLSIFECIRSTFWPVDLFCVE